jgi:hypothetical protein
MKGPFSGLTVVLTCAKAFTGVIPSVKIHSKKPIASHLESCFKTISNCLQNPNHLESKDFRDILAEIDADVFSNQSERLESF